MSVLVKGMEMPEDGAYFCEVGVIDGVGTITFHTEERQVFRLVEVPPHGRLIDADELLERFNVLQKQIDMYGREVSSCFEDSGSLCTEWWCVEEIVADAPTAIPADKDGEI